MALLFEQLIRKNLKLRQAYQQRYPLMDKYLRYFKTSGRPILGRDEYIRKILANFDRPEISNVALTGPAGVGKTAIAQGTARVDSDRYYFEVDIALMSAGDGHTDGSVQMAAKMKQLFNEIETFQDKTKMSLVIFMDEFHLIAETSPAALQALKPLLAESGRRNIRIMVATTYEEFDKYIKGDEALTERLQQIELPELADDETFNILRSMQKRYVSHSYVSDQMLREIIDLTNKYLPSRAQPRKSVNLFDAMIGWHRSYQKPFDNKMLVQVVREQIGVNIDWRIDATSLRDYLNSRVKDQQYAVQALINRMYISVASLNDDTRPQASMLFTGSSGVGKTEMAKAFTKRTFGSESKMIRFDMSEYADASTVNLFRRQLASEISQTPSAVVLLDEIEKANQEVTRLLLQVLDDARLSDRYNREVSFKDAYIIMTTNSAKEVYDEFQKNNSVSDSDVDFSDERSTNESLASYSKLIHRSLLNDDHFPDELLGRIDAIVPFKPLSEATYKKIAILRLQELQQQVYEKHAIRLHFSDKIIQYIVGEGIDIDTTAGGGRQVKEKIDRDITAPVAREIITNDHLSNLGVRVEGELMSEHKFERIGNAHIIVGPWTGTDDFKELSI